MERHASTAGLDNEKNIPISVYDIVGACGFELQGICMLMIGLKVIRKRRV
jgi:hypothetical protein